MQDDEQATELCAVHSQRVSYTRRFGRLLLGKFCQIHVHVVCPGRFLWITREAQNSSPAKPTGYKVLIDDWWEVCMSSSILSVLLNSLRPSSVAANGGLQITSHS